MDLYRRFVVLAAVASAAALAWPVSAGQDVPVYVTVPTYPSVGGACAGNRIQLQNSNPTIVWGCISSQWVDITPAGAAGSANFAEVDVDFGSASDTASMAVTGQAWVTATSRIVCAPTLLATSTRAEGEEDAVIEGLTVAIHSRVAGTGFTLVASVAQGGASGVFKIHCTGG